tara:strand:+ start:3848 stop:4903 length:1056 start_codon:yes stop_codon:yes gene_type:complete
VAHPTYQTTLVITEKINPQRVAMGWGDPVIDGLNIVDLSSNNDKLEIIIKENKDSDSLHLFSGINAFPKVHIGFKLAISNGCRIGVFTEPYDFRGIKGLFRNFRGYIYKFKYNSKIEFILTTGKIGVKQFVSFGFPKNKVFEWAYSVEKSINNNEEDNYQIPKIIFAGSLIKRKGCDILFSALKILQKEGLPFKANLFCLDKNNLDKKEGFLKKYGFKQNIEFHSFLPNLELRKKISEHDVLVLPSRHDGWGAVVSESLAEGTKVVVSNKCGASTLINRYNGEVLNDLSVTSVHASLKRIIEKGGISAKTRKFIKKNYENHVSGRVLVDYFIEILNWSDTRDSIPVCRWNK